MAAITRTARLGLFALGFLAATGVEAVRADEAYLCDGGRIVKVAPGKLDELKRTDACIAAYYGLTIGAAPHSAESRLETGALAPPAANPASLARPAPAAKRTARAPAAAPAVGEPAPAPRAAPPRAAHGTDYRNVVLLNAAPGSNAVFRHER
jgi:hypothetical protein